MVVLAVIALVVAASLCVLHGHEQGAGLHGCLPVVATVLSLLSAPLLAARGGDPMPVPVSARSWLLDVAAPPPRSDRLA